MSNGTQHDDALPYVEPALADQPDLYPGARGRCVDCDGILIAKCGEINRWHWAHEADGSTCTGSDGESAWHLAWKAWATQYGARTEVASGQHRADIIWPDGGVYELQSNYLNPVDIQNREEYWGDRLTWIYRITAGRNARLINDGDGWFKWRRPPTSMTMHERPILWHLNDRIYDATVVRLGGDVRVRFGRGEADQYGPVLYGSRPAPFDVNDAIGALRRLQVFVPRDNIEAAS